jgi:bacteriophage N4 adsorption protein B
MANPLAKKSLTEDYELGLRLTDFGYSTRFVSMAPRAGAAPIAVQSHFPDSFGRAIVQKAVGLVGLRWLVGIGLAGAVVLPNAGCGCVIGGHP